MLVCGVPKNSDEFSRIHSVEQSLFGNLSLSPAMADDIFKFCPEIYTVIVGAQQTVAAYSSAFPLKRKWAQAFIAGDITEPDLTPDMLLGRHDCLQDCCIYIGSVVVASTYDSLMKATLLASLCSWRIQQLQATSANRLTVVMTAATKQGQRMIRSAGAKPLNDGANRKDGHTVYGRQITLGFLCRVTAAMERCLNSGIVQMNLDFQPSLVAATGAPALAMA
jgi:hypothetical protein